MSLLLAQGTERYNSRRHLTKDEGEKGGEVSIRHRFVLELHMAGHLPTKHQEGKPSIQELTDYSPAMIHRILVSPNVVALKQQIMAYYDEEFEALFPDVIHAVREGLISTDMARRLEAAKIWLKAHGRMTSPGEGGVNVHLTAEDVVVQILQLASTRREEAEDAQREVETLVKHP